MELNSHDFDLVAAAPVPLAATISRASSRTRRGTFSASRIRANLGRHVCALSRRGNRRLPTTTSDGICAIFPHGGRASRAQGRSAARLRRDPAPWLLDDMRVGDGGVVRAESSRADASVPRAAGRALWGRCGARRRLSRRVVSFRSPRRVRGSPDAPLRRPRPLARACSARLDGLALPTALSLRWRRPPYGAARCRCECVRHVLFEELVRDSSAVAIVTPVEQRRRLGERANLHAHARARRQPPRGRLRGDLWIRTMGGSWAEASARSSRGNRPS